MVLHGTSLHPNFLWNVNLVLYARIPIVEPEKDRSRKVHLYGRVGECRRRHPAVQVQLGRNFRRETLVGRCDTPVPGKSPSLLVKCPRVGQSRTGRIDMSEAGHTQPGNPGYTRCAAKTQIPGIRPLLFPDHQIDHSGLGRYAYRTDQLYLGPELPDLFPGKEIGSFRALAGQTPREQGNYQGARYRLLAVYHA